MTAYPVSSEAFFARVATDGPTMPHMATACHIYGRAPRHGYPIHHGTPAHRVAVMLSGRSVDGETVRHACDNPECVRPDHLLVGTSEENIRDLAERGPSPAGPVMAEWHAARGHVRKGPPAHLVGRIRTEPAKALATSIGVPVHVVCGWRREIGAGAAVDARGGGGARKGAGRKPAPRDLAASRALLLSWAPPEDRDGSELAPRAADRLATRIGVTRQAVSEAWRKGLTPNQIETWTARIAGSK